MKDHDSRGIYVLNRKTQSYQESVEQLTDIMFRFVKRARQAKVIDRNLINNDLEKFTWNQLKEHYDTAHELAFKRKKSLVPKKQNYVYSKELY
jgi:glycogen(starch) synthase